MQTYSLDLEKGSSQYAYITDVSQTGLDVTGDFTIEAWIKLESQPTGDITGGAFTIASKWSYSGIAFRSYSLSYISATGYKLKLQIYTGSTTITFTSTDFGELPLDEWIHIAVTFTSGTAKFYFNGKEEVETATAGNPPGTFSRSSSGLQ